LSQTDLSSATARERADEIWDKGFDPTATTFVPASAGPSSEPPSEPLDARTRRRLRAEDKEIFLAEAAKELAAALKESAESPSTQLHPVRKGPMVLRITNTSSGKGRRIVNLMTRPRRHPEQERDY
jgi:hypothetical protein